MSKKLIISTIVSVSVGLFTGYLLFSGGHSEMAPSSASGEKEIAYWVAPMDPNYRRDEPGKSPMGMDLIPVYVGEETGSADVGFTIPSNIMQNLGVKVEPAKVENISPKIALTGKAFYNEEQSTHVHIRAAGWVEDLFVRSVGSEVKKGDKLFSFYSPEIATALSDYFHTKDLSERLQKASMSRLKAFGLSEQSIEIALGTGDAHKPITVFANRDGIVSKLGISEGARITGNTQAFVITNPKSMWMIADVYPEQAKLIQLGHKVTLDSGLGTVVDYIYPDADEKLQTLKVRMLLDNSNGDIKAGQYLSGELSLTPSEALTVPSLAVIHLGSSKRVIISHGSGNFEAAEVVTGLIADDRTVVLAGLQEGEKVVVNGQFMLDSESSFSGATVRMAMPETAVVETEAYAMGTINSVDAANNSINISHPDIPKIGWPSMTMDMAVVNGIDLSSIKNGQKVHFGLGRDAEGMYVVTEIHIMNDMPEDGGSKK